MFKSHLYINYNVIYNNWSLNNRELGFTLTERKSSRYTAEQITDTDYPYDIAVTSNTLKYDNTLLLNTVQILYLALPLTKRNTSISIRITKANEKYLWKCDKSSTRFQYLGSYIRSTKRDINTMIAKAWAAVNSMNIWKSNLSTHLKINVSEFQSNPYLFTVMLPGL